VEVEEEAEVWQHEFEVVEVAHEEIEVLYLYLQILSQEHELLRLYEGLELTEQMALERINEVEEEAVAVAIEE